MSLKRAARFMSLASLVLIAAMVIAACGSTTNEGNEAPGTLPQTGSGGITGTTPYSGTTPMTGTLPSPSSSMTSGITSTAGMTNEVTIDLVAQNNRFEVVSITNSGTLSGTGTMTGTTGSYDTGSMSSTTGITTSQPITVTAGAHVIVKFTNMDSVPHNLAIYTDKTLQEQIFVGQTITGPDKSVSYEFYAPSTAGYYYYQCDVHPTLMYGDFVVLKESSTR